MCYNNILQKKNEKKIREKEKVIHHTLYFYNNEPSRNKLFPILLSSLARNSQEPKLKRIFEILGVLFEKISVSHSEVPKSWIWWNP